MKNKPTKAFAPEVGTGFFLRQLPRKLDVLTHPEACISGNNSDAVLLVTQAKN